jgi:N-acetylglucosamine-6-sulfatase
MVGSYITLDFVFSTLAVAAGPSGQVAARRNIVFILVDDLRWDDLGCTGNTVVRTPNIDRIAREGVTFREAFATTPLCSPSRASILTGVYPHTHGIIDNADRSGASHDLVTFPQALQRAGYETAFVGKWHMGNDSSPRPGFDSWNGLVGQGDSYDPEVNANGKVIKMKGYVTDVLTERAEAFLRAARTKPFLLFFAHKAMHPQTMQHADGSLSDPAASNFVPAERHKDLYAGVTIPRRRNSSDTLEGKPALQRSIPGLPPLSPATGSSDASILGRLRMLASVDESTGVLLNALEDTGQLVGTMVIVTSDHGYFYGEHGLSVERRLPYEEAIRIPLLIRYPELIRAGEKRDQIATTLDFAPTLIEFGGGTLGNHLHGHSLLPLLKQNGPKLRDGFLLEYYTDTVFPRVENMGYQALRSDEWKYIEYVELEDMNELYDLARDPYELYNRVKDPSVKEILLEMRRKLAQHLAATGGSNRGSNMPLPNPEAATR